MNFARYTSIVFLKLFLWGLQLSSVADLATSSVGMCRLLCCTTKMCWHLSPYWFSHSLYTLLVVPGNSAVIHILFLQFFCTHYFFKFFLHFFLKNFGRIICRSQWRLLKKRVVNLSFTLSVGPMEGLWVVHHTYQVGSWEFRCGT